MRLLSFIDFLYSYYARVTSFPLIIQICIIFIFGCILLFSLFLSLMSFIRVKYNIQQYLEDKYIPIIDELILKYLFESTREYTLVEIYDDFYQSLGNLKKENLNLIIQRLIQCKRNFDLSFNEPFNRLMTALGIEGHIEKKFNFSNSYEKMKGIQELSSLAITAAESNIFPFTYSGNFNIRKEARNSYLRLSKNDPFKFFE